MRNCSSSMSKLTRATTNAEVGHKVGAQKQKRGAVPRYDAFAKAMITRTLFDKDAWPSDLVDVSQIWNFHLTCWRLLFLPQYVALGDRSANASVNSTCYYRL